MGESDHKMEICAWLASVNQIMRSKYFFDSEDAGWDEGDVSRFYESDFSPYEFVEWYAEKYDLLDMNRISPPRTQNFLDFLLKKDYIP